MTIHKPAESLRHSVSSEEWQMRVDLAACYRLIAMFGWDDIVFTHISARVPGPEVHFLINPYGMLFEEITASSLVKVDLAGEKVIGTPYPVNRAGFVIHSAVHEAREDIACVVHLHTDHGVAVSMLKDGLQPTSQTALFACASLGYHDYEGLALLDDEKPRLVADLGDKSHLILRNHGTLAVGKTVADAFLNIYALERACKMQILAQSTGQEITTIPGEVLARIAAQAREVTEGLGGGIAWPGLLRKLQRTDPSFRE